MIDEQPRCQGPACTQVLVVIPGHRRRQYCSDTCKMAAHRARLAAENQARYEALQLEQARQERDALRQRWGDLPPDAFDLLRSLRMTYGTVLADQVASLLTLVRDETRKSLAEERAALIDQVMLAGEQLDFPLIVTETFDLAPTVFCWSAFCGNASIEQLRLAHDVAQLLDAGQEWPFEIRRAYVTRRRSSRGVTFASVNSRRLNWWFYRTEF